ncbi:DUF202 domain-containing protein [Streptomyces sp. NPDC088116]|uniref:DUF202 domain-containing protein n=1 Tax=Streptomyces sp. NPDC088116 TaxID=3365825 RepID=UPI0037FBA008
MTEGAGHGHGQGPESGRGSGPDPERDPGLQPERTRLAWRRTTLSCTVAAVLAARQAIHHGGTAAALTGTALIALAWLGFLGVAHRRVLTLEAARPRRLTERAALTATACTVLLAVIAVTVMV